MTKKNARKRRKKSSFLFLASFGFVFLLASIISLKLAIARYISPQPQAILTLGGGQDREEFTAKFARTHPSLEIWVSSGSPTELAMTIFSQAGISNSRVHIDRRATDTVTNFTSLVKDLQQRNIHHIYLITSDFHLPRAKAIAFFVLGSHNITFTSISVPSNRSPESVLIILRDAGRALFWIITGRTGASVKIAPENLSAIVDLSR
jgi:uncharacterized SAM-binding protein YcdF (DUF218 family)